MHNIQRHVRAQIRATPDPRLGASEVNPDTKSHNVRQRRSPQFPAVRLRRLLRRFRAKEREVADHLPQIIKLGAADDRLEPSEQFIALVLGPLMARVYAPPARSGNRGEVYRTSKTDARWASRLKASDGVTGARSSVHPE